MSEKYLPSEGELKRAEEETKTIEEEKYRAVREADAMKPARKEGESTKDWLDRVRDTGEFIEADKLYNDALDDQIKARDRGDSRSYEEKLADGSKYNKAIETKGVEFADRLLHNTELARQALEYGRSLEDKTINENIESLFRKIMRALAYEPHGERPQLESDAKIESWKLSHGISEGDTVFYLEFDSSNQKKARLHYGEIGRILPYLDPDDLQVLQYCLVEGEVQVQNRKMELNRKEIEHHQRKIKLLQNFISKEETEITASKNWLSAVEGELQQ